MDLSFENVTPQMKYVALGVTVGLIAKFGFKKSSMESLTLGLAALAAYSILVAHNAHVAATTPAEDVAV